MQTRSQAAAIITLIAAASSSVAQWTVTNLHPAGSTQSYAYAASGGQQAGYAYMGAEYRASLWGGTAASWVDLHPAGANGTSVAFASSGGQQAGRAEVGGVFRASLWSGTAASWVDLNPVGSTYSDALAASDGQQAGYALVGGFALASLWSGTVGSWVDLNPAGATGSIAFAVSGGQQAGWASIGGVLRASLWSGTAASWVDLTPAGATESIAYAISDGQQAGYAYVAGVPRASLWSGSAATWVDLNPVGSTSSLAFAASGGQQVGRADVRGVTRASLWSGTAASWVDLSAFLPAGFSESYAQGISSDDVNTYIAGYSYNTLTGRYEALLWKSICVTPSITAHPVPSTPSPGATASFAVAAGGSEPITYQWRKNESTLSNGGRFSGVNTPSMAITNVQASDQGTYDCIVTDACSSSTSNGADLSCKAAFSAHPIGGTFKAGRQIALSASHPPAGSVTYRWKKDGSNLFNAGTYSGVTTPTLTINTTDPSQTGSHALSVTNVCGVTVSNAALVEVVCGADLDNGSGTGTPDGGIDITDLLYFLGAFEAGSPAADLDNGTGNGISDGGIDISDLLFFLGRFEAGC